MAEPSLLDPREDPRVQRGMDAQIRLMRELFALGVPRVGWKIGITDPAVQRQLQLAAPVVGFVSGESLYRTGEGVSLDPQGDYRVEVEIALVLGDDLEPGSSPAAAQAAIASLLPAIELVDFRNARPDLEGIVAHNIFHAGAVLDGSHLAPENLALDSLSARVVRNGRLERSLDPTLRPADLALLAQHVADSLEPFGESLRAGDRILSGSLVQPLPVQAGDKVRAEIEGLGTLEVRFFSRS